MTQIARLDAAIQRGRGVAGRVLGQTYDVRRLTDTTNGSISNNTPVISNFPARIRRITSKVAIENASFDLLVFEATCDNRPLVIGDLLTQTGYGNDGSVYTYAQARPTRETLWVRTEFNCFISRMTPLGGDTTQQPTVGWVTDTGYGGVPKSNEQILTLVNGLYSFATSGSPAGVFCGLQPLNRVRDGSTLGTPTDLYRDHFLIYVPEIPGEQLQETDRINFPNSDRYEVALVYSSGDIGLAGNICIAEKLGT